MAQVPTPPASRHAPEAPESQQGPPLTDPAAELISSLDTLLERYLILLDNHQALQEDLGKRFSSGFLSLAQANYTCPPGRRYGADYYDERMKAIRKARRYSSVQPLPQHETSDHSKPKIPTDRSLIPGGRFMLPFSVQHSSPRSQSPVRDGEEHGHKPDGQCQSSSDHARDQHKEQASAEHEVAGSQPQPHSEPAEGQSTAYPESQPSKRRFRSSDPITWYGILVPQSLRTAQKSFTEAVDELVPNLASMTVEMRDVEEKVERLRKEIAGIASLETKV